MPRFNQNKVINYNPVYLYEMILTNIQFMQYSPDK